MRVLPFLALVGCATSASTKTTDSADTADTPTWSDDVRPIMASRCTTCHTTGGAAPFPLETWQDAEPLAEVLLSAVESGSMPPWSADPDCHEYDGQRLIPEDEVAVLRAWVSGGAPEGDPTDPISVEVPSLDPTDTLQAAVPYTPDFTTGADDYRCLVLDITVPETTYMRASQVVPDTNQVHHGLLYALHGDQVTAMRALEAEDEAPGYTCFSGPVPTEDSGSPAGGLPSQIGAWVPGAAPNILPDDQGVRILADSVLVLQLHFNAQGTEAQPDQTTVKLVLDPTEPENLFTTHPLPVLDLDIPAGDAWSTSQHTYTNWTNTPLNIHSVAAHMHLLGVQVGGTVRAPDGEETCLLDIPEWDFAWQQAYALPEGDRVTLPPGGQIDVACTYDNSAENQPMVDGELREPTDVAWGEGTDDEMCLLYIGTVEPFSPVVDPDQAACASAEACVASCPEDSWDCLFSCETMTSDCASCSLNEGMGVLSTQCPTEVLNISTCAQDCGMDTVLLGGAPGVCMHATCPDAYAALLACGDPDLASEASVAALATCGVAY